MKYYFLKVRPNHSLMLYLLLVTLLGFPGKGLAQDDTLFWTDPHAFHDREGSFSDLSFDIGETLLLKSPDPESFNPLILATFEGRPRIGMLDTYKVDIPQLRAEIPDTRKQRQAVTEEFTHNMGCYLSLLCLQLIPDEFTTEKLMVYNSEGYGFTDKYHTFSDQVDGKLNYFIVPRFHIEGMAAGMLTKERYKEYYCPSRENCSEGYRQRQGRIWAGPQSNEFKKRAAYKKFVETEVPKLLAWAKDVNREVALINRVILTTYDFQKQGFDVVIGPVKGSVAFASQDLQFWPRDPEALGFDINTGFVKNVLLAIPPEKAESIKNRLKTEYHQRSTQMLYSVMVAEIYSMGPKRRGGTHSAFGGNIGFLYDYKDTTIRFYLDPELKELVYETKL